MDREKEIDLKISQLREKNKLLEKRHKLVEEDKKAAQVQKQFESKSVKTTNEKKNKRFSNAHMDEIEEDVNRNRKNSSGDFRKSRFENDGNHQNYRGKNQFRGNARGDSNFRSKQKSSERYLTKAEQLREQQRLANIEEMEEELKQAAEKSHSERHGYLYDPSRDRPGQYRKSVPPRSIQYNPKDLRKPRMKSSMEMSREELELQMTGRQRIDHQKWLEQRKEADKNRLARAQAQDGQWKRAWDVEKIYKHENDNRQKKHGKMYSGINQRHDSSTDWRSDNYRSSQHRFNRRSYEDETYNYFKKDKRHQPSSSKYSSQVENDDRITHDDEVVPNLNIKKEFRRQKNKKRSQDERNEKESEVDAENEDYLETSEEAEQNPDGFKRLEDEVESDLKESDYEKKIEEDKDDLDDVARSEDAAEIEEDLKESEDAAESDPKGSEDVAETDPKESEDVAETDPKGSEDVAETDPKGSEDVAESDPKESEDVAGVNPKESKDVQVLEKDLSESESKDLHVENKLHSNNEDVLAKK